MVAPAEQLHRLPTPPPAVVHAHIGRLLRELRLARRLLRLARDAEELAKRPNNGASRKAVANA